MFIVLLAAAEFALSAGAGSRGERRAEAVARVESEEASLSLGAIDFAGPQAKERQEIAIAARRGVLKGELRVVPDLQRYAGEFGVQLESLSFVLGGRTASLGRMRLRGASARIELEGQLADPVRAGVSASAFALQLDGPSWAAWGMATTDWAQRWETGAWLSWDFESFALTPSLSAAQSAQPGVYELRASIAVEVPLGPVKLRVEPAAARQWPQLWMFDLSAGIALTL